MRAWEMGRTGPLSSQKPPAVAAVSLPDKVGRKATTFLADPVKEMDKLENLYETVMKARRTAGEKPVPFHKLATLVRSQVKKLRESGYANVTFQVAVKDGQINLKARGSKNAPE